MLNCYSATLVLFCPNKECSFEPCMRLGFEPNKVCLLCPLCLVSWKSFSNTPPTLLTDHRVGRWSPSNTWTQYLWSVYSMLPLSSTPIFPTNNKTHKTIFKYTLLEKSRCEFSNIFKYTLFLPTLPGGGYSVFAAAVSARPPAVTVRHLRLPSLSASCLSPPAVSARRRCPPAVCAWFCCPPSLPCGVCTEFDSEGWMQSLAHDCHPSIWLMRSIVLNLVFRVRVLLLCATDSSDYRSVYLLADACTSWQQYGGDAVQSILSEYGQLRPL